MALQAGTPGVSLLAAALLILGLLVAAAGGLTAHSAVASRIGRSALRVEATRSAAATVIAVILAALLLWLALRAMLPERGLVGLLQISAALWPALVFPVLGLLSGVTLAGRPDSGGLLVRAGNLLADLLAFWLRAPATPGGNGQEDDDREFEITMASGEEVEAEEREYIENILELGATTAHEVMTPRTDVVALDAAWDPQLIVATVAEARFSRFPVYEDSIDNVIGIMHLRDLLEFLARNDDLERLDLRAMLMDPMFVPESKKIDDALRELQAAKAHMAVVLDEYGGTEGILTIEDLLEEIVGEIQDEYDDESRMIHQREDGCWVIDGQLPLAELNEELGWSLSAEDVDTLGGFITDALGHIPEPRETLEHEQLTFTVLSVDKNRVSRVLAAVLEDGDAAAD